MGQRATSKDIQFGIVSSAEALSDMVCCVIIIIRIYRYASGC